MAAIDKNMELTVERILEEIPSTRKSDDELVYQYMLESEFAWYLSKPYGWILKHGKSHKLPMRSSISRARRKVQERRPELKDKDTAGYRAELEEEYREWARNN